MYTISNIRLQLAALIATMVVAPIALAQYAVNSSVLLIEDIATGKPEVLFMDSIVLTKNQLKDETVIQIPHTQNYPKYAGYQLIINDTTVVLDQRCGATTWPAQQPVKILDGCIELRNQTGAACVSFENNVFLWGGRGLFTTKNILTSLNFNTLRWHRINTGGLNVPPRSHMIYTVNNNNNNKLFVFGGINLDDQYITSKKNMVNNYVYILNLHTLQWEKGPKVKEKYKSDTYENTQNYFLVNGSFVSINHNYIHEYNFENNYLKTYTNNNYKTIKSLIYSQKTNMVSYIYTNSRGQYVFKSLPLEKFLGKTVITDTLYRSYTIDISIIILSTLLALFGIHKAAKYQRLKKSPVFYYLKKEGQFKFNNARLPQLNSVQFQILLLFFKHNNQYVKLVDINDIINKHTNHLSVDALQKRRKNELNQLAIILSLFLNKKESDIFKVKQLASDKRLKEIKLNIQVKII
jgi:hypothetical protein